MDITVNPGRLSGTVAAPPSKSDLHRKCIAAAFCGDGAAVRAAALCDDTRATLDCLAAMGFSVGFDGESVRIGGRDPSVREATLDCGESGSTARFLLPAAAYFLDCATLVGRGRLPARPFAALTDALRANGTAVRGDFLPIAVSGGLHAGVYRMRGDVSSQFFTGLLLALPALGRESSVELTTPLESAPYVALTNAVLRAFGVEIEETPSGFRVPAGAAYRAPAGLAAEGDWSSGAFWLLARALGSDVAVTGLSETSAQGDRRVTALLDEIGAPAPSRSIDMTDVPDLLPALAVAAGASTGRTGRRAAAAEGERPAAKYLRGAERHRRARVGDGGRHRRRGHGRLRRRAGGQLRRPPHRDGLRRRGDGVRTAGDGLRRGMRLEILRDLF